MTKALHGLRIVDTTHVLAGPFASYQLAVLGAEVIKVEAPDDPDQSRRQGSDRALDAIGLGTAYLAQGSGKASLAVDLKTEAGRAILKRLIGTADVFVENYRPGAFEALGLGYADLSRLNPRLIYCSISGFGQTGPRREQTAYDGVIQAYSGMMAMTGTAESGPLKCGAPVVDYATGTTAAFAIAAALFQRERNGGRGQHIDVSMHDVALTLCSPYVTGYLWNGSRPKPKGNDYPFATIGCYEASDGPIMVSASNLGQQERLWRVLGRADLIKHDNGARLDACVEERAVLADIFPTRTAAQWEEFLTGHRIPAARVRSLEEALEDGQAAARGLLHRHRAPDSVLDGLTVPMAGFTMSGSPPGLTMPPQPVGAQTADILRELGYADEDIARFRRDGAIDR